jgi:hypothetical protein
MCHASAAMPTARKGHKTPVPAATEPKVELAASSDATPAEERRSGGDRRDGGLDRRAFWRPTPDRRREARERGRRSADPS